MGSDICYTKGTRLKRMLSVALCLFNSLPFLDAWPSLARMSRIKHTPDLGLEKSLFSGQFGRSLEPFSCGKGCRAEPGPPGQVFPNPFPLTTLSSGTGSILISPPPARGNSSCVPWGINLTKVSGLGIMFYWCNKYSLWFTGYRITWMSCETMQLVGI